MGHKRILGKTTDFITGREITDTDDERYRQKLARFLIGEKGYLKEDIRVKRLLEFEIDGKKILSMVDFAVEVKGRVVMVIRYGPGSIVTRERPAIASARLIETYRVPVTVVTNGEDAEIIDTDSEAVTATGIDAIPAREMLAQKYGDASFISLSEKQKETEKRILSAYDWLEHSLECDDDWCAAE